jgi:3-phytase/alkaline phosphatase D
VNQGITTAFKHFTEAGQFEGRNPSPFFDTAFYLGRNPDVAAAVQNRQLSAIAHFIQFGQTEGRIPQA